MMLRTGVEADLHDLMRANARYFDKSFGELKALRRDGKLAGTKIQLLSLGARRGALGVERVASGSGGGVVMAKKPTTILRQAGRKLHCTAEGRWIWKDGGFVYVGRRF